MLDLISFTGLPSAQGLAHILGSGVPHSLPDQLGRALVAPAADLAARPSKRFRAQLVTLSHDLCCGSGPGALHAQLVRCTQAVELLHAGSLIIDDIQDGSAKRRGGEAIHRIYGLPGALCTGNWLYFWPLRLIRDLGLPLAQEHQAFALYHEALERAHWGQALDLKLRADELPQADVAALAGAILELKTGAVTALAMGLGALLAGAPETQLRAVESFGRRFGVVLQKFDDLGNVGGRGDPQKRYEDLLHGRLSGVWAAAATVLDGPSYATFCAHVGSLTSGNDQPLVGWLAHTRFLERAAAAVRQEFRGAYADLAEGLDLDADHAALAALKTLGETLFHAYL